MGFKARKPRKRTYELLISYDIDDVDDWYETDRRLDEAAGQCNDSGGIGFGKRDLVWIFPIKELRDHAADNIASLGIISIEITLEDKIGDEVVYSSQYQGTKH